MTIERHSELNFSFWERIKLLFGAHLYQVDYGRTTKETVSFSCPDWCDRATLDAASWEDFTEN